MLSLGAIWSCIPSCSSQGKCTRVIPCQIYSGLFAGNCSLLVIVGDGTREAQTHTVLPLLASGAVVTSKDGIGHWAFQADQRCESRVQSLLQG